jgi:hypothetical protein
MIHPRDAAVRNPGAFEPLFYFRKPCAPQTAENPKAVATVEQVR